MTKVSNFDIQTKKKCDVQVEQGEFLRGPKKSWKSYLQRRYQSYKVMRIY